MGKERQSCEGCPDCEIRITPDPDDWKIKNQLAQQVQTSTSSNYKRNTVLAAATVLFISLAAVVAIRFRTYDPAASADSDTLFDYCIFAGMALLPVASVCFAKSLFIGWRFRFLLSWLVGFLIPWSVLVYEIFYPRTPPEGSYCTKAEECLLAVIFVAVITGAVNGFDSLVERLLAKWDNALPRNWLFRFAARLAGTILLSSLIVALLFGVSITL